MILLDTCALLWLVEGSDRITHDVRTRIDSEPVVSVSSISALEIGLKSRTGKLQLPMPPAEWWARACEHHAISILPVEPETLIRSTELPWLHRDPVDRIIIATALRANAPVVTSDEHFGAYGVEVIL